MHTLAAALVIVAGWLVLAVALVGLGRGARRVIVGTVVGACAGDFWTGLSVAVALVLLLHLVFAVTSWLWLLLGPLALLGLLTGGRPVLSLRRAPVLWSALAAVVVLFVADRALQPVTAYDSGLYHLPMLDWLHAYPAVPGLGNFAGRLGYNSGSLMFVALIGTVVPAAIASHFANSLLMVALCLELVLSVRRIMQADITRAAAAPTFLLVLAAPSLLIPLYSSDDISSPSLDLPALVVTLAAALYTARAVSASRADPELLVPAVALLALLPVVRVELGIFSVAGGALLVLAVLTHRLDLERPRRWAGMLAALGTLVVGSWVGQGLVLTGYPAFPATALGIPVSWRVPPAYGHLEQDWITSWARAPGLAPRIVLHSWAWFRPWAVRTVATREVQGILVLAGAGVCLILALWLFGRLSPRSRPLAAGASTGGFFLCLFLLVHASRTCYLHPLLWLGLGAAAMIVTPVVLLLRLVADGRQNPAAAVAADAGTAVVGVAALPAAVAWFFLAPDPRFVTGVLWLVAAVPAAAALSWLWPRRRLVAWAALAVVVVTAGSYPLHEVRALQELRVVHATAGGRWGLPVAAPGSVKTVVTHGVAVHVPVTGDQCWARVLPCTADPTRPWQLRSPGHFGAGFVMTNGVLPPGALG